MRRVLVSAAKQAVVISIVVVVVGLAFNALRKDGIPLVADAEAFRVRTEAEFVKVDNAWKLFDEGKAIFVDARDARVFSIERIEGAISIPPTGPDLEAAGWITGTESSVICYASEESQRQAGVVADKLIEMGTKEVFVLYGGLEAWKAAGYPTERD
jgi:rhodanese-related sulfurtransferase